MNHEYLAKITPVQKKLNSYELFCLELQDFIYDSRGLVLSYSPDKKEKLLQFIDTHEHSFKLHFKNSNNIPNLVHNMILLDGLSPKQVNSSPANPLIIKDMLSVFAHMEQKINLPQVSHYISETLLREVTIPLYYYAERENQTKKSIFGGFCESLALSNIYVAQNLMWEFCARHDLKNDLKKQTQVKQKFFSFIESNFIEEKTLQLKFEHVENAQAFAQSFIEKIIVPHNLDTFCQSKFLSNQAKYNFFAIYMEKQMIEKQLKNNLQSGATFKI